MDDDDKVWKSAVLDFKQLNKHEIIASRPEIAAHRRQFTQMVRWNNRAPRWLNTFLDVWAVALLLTTARKCSEEDRTYGRDDDENGERETITLGSNPMVPQRGQYSRHMAYYGVRLTWPGSSINVSSLGILSISHSHESRRNRRTHVELEHARGTEWDWKRLACKIPFQ